jgi:2-keto-4-pentenoate hydratase
MDKIEPSTIDAFWQARQRGEFFPVAFHDKLSIEQAYDVQLALIDRRIAAGEQHIGWKVGLTSVAIQQQFQCHEPVFGCILNTVPSSHAFAPGDLIQPGFENELCMRIAHDLPAAIGLDEARAAVESVHPALEIIETRGPFTAQLALALADNAQQKTCVLGRPVALPQDLEGIEAVVTVNGQEAGRGLGSAVLGNPLHSIVWLAKKLAERGRHIRAGDIVMTGSFTRQFPIAPGDRIQVSFAGIGAVETSMTV